MIRISFITTSMISMTLMSGLLTGCLKGPGFLKQDESAVGFVMSSSDLGDGIVSGQYMADSSVTQTMSASGSSEISGSSISFPPGSLAIDTSVSLQTGTDVATGLASSTLGIGTASGLTTASSAVSVQSSTPTDAIAPFTISLPLSATALYALTTDTYAKLVVFYHAQKVGENKKFLGVITRDRISLDSGKAYVQTRWFGTYQAAVTSELITTAKEVDHNVPIITKAEERKLTPIVWTMGTPTFNATKQEGTFPITATGFSKLKACAAYVHEDKNGPFIRRDYTDKIEDLNMSDPYHYRPYKTAAHTIYVRFECEDINGRRSQSEFSAGLAVPVTTPYTGGPGPGPGPDPGPIADPTGLVLTAESNITMKLNWTHPSGNIVGFKLAWEPVPGVPAERCTSGAGSLETSDPNASLGTFVRPLSPNTTYNIRVCSRTDTGYYSVGTVQTQTTKNDPFTCNGGGDLSTTCTISAYSFGAGPIYISGLASVVTFTGTSQTTVPSDQVFIDILGDLIISSGASLLGNLNIHAQNVSVNSTGFIRADMKGYAGAIGNGPGPGGGMAGNSSTAGGGGGGHGGMGGDGGSNGASGGALNGSVSEIPPLSWGSGGGGDGAGAMGGAGGGAIYIHAFNNITVDGDITSFGQNGFSGTSTGTGGGAGGSIHFIADGTFAGTGYVNVSGGMGGSASAAGGGGGGGGFINVITSNSTFTPGHCTISGGTPGTGSASGNPGIGGSVLGC